MVRRSKYRSLPQSLRQPRSRSILRPFLRILLFFLSSSALALLAAHSHPEPAFRATYDVEPLHCILSGRLWLEVTGLAFGGPTLMEWQFWRRTNRLRSMRSNNGPTCVEKETDRLLVELV